MLLSSLQAQAKLVFDVLPPPVQANVGLIGFIVALTFTWIAWRIWKFTIIPRLYPDDPLDFPYTIPWIGHGRAFFSNSNAVLSNARAYFGHTNEPFGLTIAGSKTYVITKSKDVAEAYRNTHTLSFNEFVQAMMTAMGNTQSCVKTMYTPLPTEKAGFPNRQGKPLATLAREMHIHQLYPGDRLDFLENKFLSWFDERMVLEKLPAACPYAIRATDQDIVLPLMEWCSDFFTRAGQRAYFGDILSDIDPQLTKTFIVFDELSWQVLYQYPAFLATDMKNARNAIKDALKAYIQIPQSKRTGDAWFTKAMEDEMRALNISDEDIAMMLVTIYWGINTNTRKAAFWLISYMLHAPSLIDIVRDETKPAFKDDGTIDLEYLHKSCPQLDAMWNETIRMSAYSASVRFITQDTMIGGKVLRKGNRLMIPYRQLHFEPSVFGETANSFDHERFLKKSNLTQSNNWRPFGGGNTMCPGRYVAKRSVLLFISMLLHRFDVEMDGYQPIPTAEEGKPVLGIMSIKEHEDMRVRLSPRMTAA